MELNKYILFLSIPFAVSLFYQVKIFDIRNKISCLNAFKFNNFSGFLNFLFILLIDLR